MAMGAELCMPRVYYDQSLYARPKTPTPNTTQSYSKVAHSLSFYFRSDHFLLSPSCTQRILRTGRTKQAERV